MLRGFEDWTHELTDDEVIYARDVWKFLSNNKDEWFTNTDISEHINSLHAVVLVQARVRKIIQFCRVQAAMKIGEMSMPMIVASGNGYTMTHDTKKQYDSIVSQAQRISSQQLTLRACDIVYRAQLEADGEAYQLSIMAELGEDKEIEQA